MRILRYSLLALAVLAAFAVSVVLVVRSVSNSPLWSARTERAPSAEPPVASPAETAPMPASAPPAEETAAPPVAAEPAPPAANTPAEPPAGTSDASSERPFSPGSLSALGTLLADRPEMLTLGAPPAAGPQPETPASQRTAGAGLTLTPEQSERVRYVLLSHNIMQVETTGLALRVGGTVPADVPLQPFPIEMADVVPAYAQYSYVMAQNQIAIVANANRRIDVVLPIEQR